MGRKQDVSDHESIGLSYQREFRVKCTTLAQESAFHGNPNVDVMTSWDSIKPAPAPVLKHVKIDPKYYRPAETSRRPTA